jgi:hypothetical protein
MEMDLAIPEVEEYTHFKQDKAERQTVDRTPRPLPQRSPDELLHKLRFNKTPIPTKRNKSGQ